MLALDPLAAVDPGFLMSVLGSLSIAALSVPFSKWIARRLHRASPSKTLDWLIQSASISVCAWCCTTPVAALTFGSVSLVAVPANILAAPFAELAVGAGIPAMLCAAAGLEVLAWPLGWAAGLAAGALRYIAWAFAALPFSTAAFSQGWLTLWLFGAAALILLPLAFRKGWAYLKYSVLLASIALLFGLLANAVLMRDVAVVELTRLQDGMAIACSKNGSAVLVTRGLCWDDGRETRELLAKAGGKPDAMLSLDGDSAAELELAKKLSPQTAVLSAQAARRYPGAAECAPGTLAFWDGAEIQAGSGCCALRLDGIYILYIFGECDIMELAPELRRADLVLLDGAEPENMRALGCKYLVETSRGAEFDGAGETLLLGGDGLRFVIRDDYMERGRRW